MLSKCSIEAKIVGHSAPADSKAAQTFWCQIEAKISGLDVILVSNRDEISGSVVVLRSFGGLGCSIFSITSTKGVPEADYTNLRRFWVPIWGCSGGCFRIFFDFCRFFSAAFYARYFWSNFLA